MTKPEQFAQLWATTYTQWH